MAGSDVEKQRALWISEVADQRRRASANAQRPYDAREHEVTDPYFPEKPWLVPESQAASGARRLHDSVNALRCMEEGDSHTVSKLQGKLRLLEKYQPQGAQTEKRALAEQIARLRGVLRAKRAGEGAGVERRLARRSPLADASRTPGRSCTAQATAASRPSILRTGSAVDSKPLAPSVSFDLPEGAGSLKRLARSRSPLALARPQCASETREPPRWKVRFPLDAAEQGAQASERSARRA
uniref:Uncharacterized protein n=1 Tax=Alexandrium monilatum TaxID=311494 RepID=A0A7S4UXS5_9DINO